MTDGEMNAAIAGYLGWSNIGHVGSFGGVYIGGTNPSKTKAMLPIPNYSGDLNAMHEAEKKLDVAAFLEYYRHLIDLQGPDQFVFHMTARQRAEAFLRTVGVMGRNDNGEGGRCMKVTSEDLTKLRGPNGERFTSEAEYREPKVGEYFMNSDGGVCIAHVNGYDKLVLTRAKTAREWLSELPDGWREEALANGDDLDKVQSSLSDAVSRLDWTHSPSGGDAWRSVWVALSKGKPLPPHPSKVKPKPKVERLEVVENGWNRVGWLVAGEWSLDCWPGRTDFRGFVYVLPNGKEEYGCGETILWWSEELRAVSTCHLDKFTTPLRPKFVEVAK